MFGCFKDKIEYAFNFKYFAYSFDILCVNCKKVIISYFVRIRFFNNNRPTGLEDHSPKTCKGVSCLHFELHYGVLTLFRNSYYIYVSLNFPILVEGFINIIIILSSLSPAIVKVKKYNLSDLLHYHDEAESQ